MTTLEAVIGHYHSFAIVTSCFHYRQIHSWYQLLRQHSELLA